MHFLWLWESIIGPRWISCRTGLKLVCSKFALCVYVCVCVCVCVRARARACKVSDIHSRVLEGSRLPEIDDIQISVYVPMFRKCVILPFSGLDCPPKYLCLLPIRGVISHNRGITAGLFL
jgi:hypothetical protein